SAGDEFKHHVGSNLIAGYFATEVGASVGTEPALLKAAIADKVIQLPYYKSHSNWVSNYIQKNGLVGANSDIVSAQAAAAISKLARAAIDARTFNKVGGTEAVNSAFNMQFWHNTKEWSQVALTPNCLPEGRLTLQGSEVLFGVKLSAVLPVSLVEKVKAVGQMSVECFFGLVRSHGFAFKSEPGTLQIIPAGFLVIGFLVSEEPCEGMRWSFVRSDAAEQERILIKTTMEQAMEEFGADATMKAISLALGAA
ncbi:unnamed protein product, partial [Prorocentrum cordatum]